ncbi:hypothetical protein B9Z19DRAFT_1126940 [Tuber borchii]|uniref:Uncharacterized protein n=1 Tax=Tuber borchii TaxID=42251 RepID=A0A2T6ZS87_TUBBO|nr:hypothetical protein B9Z19DRAFT_1126940 [Tuber borchii]
MSALSNVTTAGRASAASTAREKTISPRPPSAARRPISAAARGTTGISPLFSQPSTSTLSLRATGSSGTLSASSATSSMALEALKVKVSDLEDKKQEPLEQLSKVGSHPTTNGHTRADTEELESELADLNTRITIIQEAVKLIVRLLRESLQPWPGNLGQRMKDTNDNMIVRRAKELKTLDDGLGAKEKALLPQINTLKTSFEPLQALHDEKARNTPSLIEKDVHESSKVASEKNTEVLESRQNEIGVLGSVIEVLKEEFDKAALGSEASEEAIRELQERHAVELAEAANVKTVVENAEAKFKKRFKSTQSSYKRVLRFCLLNFKKGNLLLKVLEEDLVQKSEAAKLESAEALETTQKEAAEEIEAGKKENEAQRKQIEFSIEVLKKEASGAVESKDKQWESKIDQLMKANLEQINNLIAQLHTANEEIQEASPQMELVKQQSEAEIKSAQEQVKEEVAALQSTLDPLNKR